MSAGGDYRMKRPAELEHVIQAMIAEAGFPAIRDVLLFSAFYGFKIGGRTRMTRSGEPVAWHTLTYQQWSTVAIRMVAAVERPEDRTIVMPERTAEQLAILEECATAGLEDIQRKWQSGSKSLAQVVEQLVVDALSYDDELSAPDEFSDRDLEEYLL